MQDAGNWKGEKQINRKGAEYAEKRRGKILDRITGLTG